MPEDPGQPTTEEIVEMRRLDEIAVRKVREFVARFHEVVEFERSLKGEQPADPEAAVPTTATTTARLTK